jgi:hypothetical protein
VHTTELGEVDNIANESVMTLGSSHSLFLFHNR